MNKKIALLLLCCILSSLLISCYDAREVDEIAYVMTIGIDKGVANKTRFSFQIPLMKGAAGGQSQSTGKSQGAEYTVFAIDAPSFFAAVNMLNTTISRKLNFVHTKYIVFSEETMKADFMKTSISSIFRFREIRKSAEMIIVKGEAYDFLKETQPVLGTMLSKYQDTLIQQSEETGFFPSTQVHNVYNAMKSYYIQPIAILAGVNDFKAFDQNGDKWKKKTEPKAYFAGEVPRIGGSKIEFMGSVIFNGPQMVGELNGFDTRILLMIRGEVKSLVFISEDPLIPDKAITIDMREVKKPKVKVSFDGEDPIIDLKIYLEGDYLIIESEVEYEESKNKRILEKDIEKQLKSQIDDLIERCKLLESDVFGFGYAAARNFKTIQEFENYNWNKHFKNAQINTEVDFVVRRPGTMVKSSPIISSEGEVK